MEIRNSSDVIAAGKNQSKLYLIEYESNVNFIHLLFYLTRTPSVYIKNCY